MDDESKMAIPRRWVSYLAKSVVLLAFLYVVSLLVSRIPASGVAAIVATAGLPAMQVAGTQDLKRASR